MIGICADALRENFLNLLPVIIVASCATFVAILKSLRHELNPGWAAKRAEREKNAAIFHETLMLLTQDESTAGRPQPIDVDPATSQITFVFTVFREVGYYCRVRYLTT